MNAMKKPTDSLRTQIRAPIPAKGQNSDGDRTADLEAALEAIRKGAWKPGQTLPKLRHANGCVSDC
jgi:hypothetical protein